MAGVTLRDYQREALEAVRRDLLAGKWSQVMVLPTGAGKTYVLAHLPLVLRDWLGQFPRSRMLILAHREELLDQAATHLRAINPSLMIGVEQASRRTGPMHDVVIASVQTLQGRRLHALHPEDFRIIVVDEAHHAPSASYQKILAHFGVLPPDAPTKRVDPAEYIRLRHACQNWWKETKADRLLLGVTATPNRADGVGLEWTFQSIVYSKDLRWMIDRGYLVGPRGFLVDTRTSLDGVGTVAGDFNQGQLAETVNTPERNTIAVQGWQAQAKDEHGQVLPTLAFTVDVKHAQDMAETAQAHGINADWASGENRSPLAAFKAGKVDFLANCQLATEGFDHPPAACALMARPTKSHTLYAQSIGRVLRTAPGKGFALVLDVVDVSSRHPLVTAGSLFGLPASLNPQGKDLTEVADRIIEAREQFPGLDVNTLRSITDLERRITQINLWEVRECPEVQEYAKLAWVESGLGRYQLTIPRARGVPEAGRDFLELHQDLLGSWTASFRACDQPAAVPVATAETLAAAFQRAEGWIGQLRPDFIRMASQSARWRFDAPSEKQIAMLRKFGATVDLTKLTKGEASALLDRYFARRNSAGRR